MDLLHVELQTQQTGAAPSNPQIVLANPRQRKIAAILEVEGIGEVRIECLKIAREKHSKKPEMESWKKFLQWADEKEDWITFYLASMYPDFLAALVTGTILREIQEDPKRFGFIAKQKRKLKSGPQVYISICGDRIGQGSAARRNWTKLCSALVTTQLVRVLQTMRSYLQVGNAQEEARCRRWPKKSILATIWGQSGVQDRQAAILPTEVYSF